MRLYGCLDGIQGICVEFAMWWAKKKSYLVQHFVLQRFATLFLEISMGIVAKQFFSQGDSISFGSKGRAEPETFITLSVL